MIVAASFCLINLVGYFLPAYNGLSNGPLNLFSRSFLVLFYYSVLRMNSSMSPTWLICATLYITVAARFIAYPLPTDAIAGYDKTYSSPTQAPEVVNLRIRADDIPTYTITYASDSVCGYLSGSVQIPITCENKNRCLWELESFKYLACELDGETTGIAHTKCLARDEALDPNLCEDDCVSNTYNLLW